MVAASSDASTAPILNAGGATSGTVTLQWGLGSYQWYRFAVPTNRQWQSGLSSIVFPGVSVDQYQVYVARSSNPNENGAALSLALYNTYSETGTAVSVQTLTNYQTTYSGYLWIYFRIRHTQGNTISGPVTASWHTVDQGHNPAGACPAVAIPTKISGGATAAATASISSPPPPIVATPDEATGSSTVTAAERRARARAPQTVAGATGVGAYAWTRFGHPAVVAGTTTVQGGTGARDIIGDPDEIDGTTLVRFPGDVAVEPDEVAGSTTVTATVYGVTHIAQPDTVAGTTAVRLVILPDLSENLPIELAVDLAARLLVIPADDMESVDELAMSGRYGATSVGADGTIVSARRTVPAVSLTMPTPLVVQGQPVVPDNWGRVALTGRLTQAPKHIHSTPAQLTWDPHKGQYAEPPPPTRSPFAGRWVVDDLPDPPDGGYYWLGDASWSDGTGNYSGGHTYWAPHASTPHAPAWRSFFPYKPSVRAWDAYLPGGDIVHHPKGVHFNTHYAEHMWTDFGRAMPQPFTWAIAGMIVSYPTPHYRHWLLDAGHVPPHTDAYLPDNWSINEDLGYRTALTYSRASEAITTRTNFNGPKTIRARVDPNLRPKVFFGVYDGAKSIVGAFGPGSRRYRSGAVDNGTDQKHRFYLLGREQGHVGQMHGAHMLLFEIRYWREALSVDELDKQYDQLAGAYQFNRYRSV